MIDVMSNLRLEVETPPPAGKVKNLVRNYDGALGGYFWATPSGGIVGRSPLNAGWLRYTHTAGATVLTTERMQASAGQYVSARWRASWSAGGLTLPARVDFLTATGALAGSSALSTAFASAPTTDRTIGPFLAPAGTVAARLVFVPTGALTGNVVELQEVGFVVKATNAAVTWATDVVMTGPTWLNVLGTSVDLEWERETLDLGMLSATLRDATLDPMIATTIRPGRECRVTVKHGVTGVWETVFPGELTDFEVTYDPAVLAKNPADPKHCQITLAAVDPTRTLANTSRPYGVNTLADLRTTLEDVGVPWSVNGADSHTHAAPTVVSLNENASALDQIALTRDSRGAHAWVDRRGVVNIYDPANVAPFENTDFETDVSGWSGSGTRTRVTSPVASGTGAMQVTQTITAATSVTTPGVRYVPGHPYSLSVKTRAATTPRSARIVLNYRDAIGGTLGSTAGAYTANVTGAWTTHTVSAPTAPLGTAYVFAAVEFLGTVAGEAHYVDELRGLNADVILDQSTWSNIDIGSGSAACINEVTVDFLRFDAGEGKTEVMTYGPYRDEASVAQYGVRAAKFTIHGTSEVANVDALAARVLAGNAFPQVAASGVTVPIKSTADLTCTKALADLHQLARVAFATKGYSAALRISGIRHRISASAKHKAKWIVDYTFEPTKSVAAARLTPPPADPPSLTPVVRSGVVGLTFPAGSRSTGVIYVFPKAFAAPPNVVVSPHDPRFVAGAYNITATQMTVDAYFEGASVGGVPYPLNVSWIGHG